MASQYVKLPKTGGGGGGGAVSSFNGRTGAVVPLSGDYTAGQVVNVPAGNISSTNVQNALNELDSEKQAVITGAATTIVSSNLTASKALVSDASGKVAASTVTDTELANLSGSSSNLQTQLNNKQPLDSDLTAIAALSTTGLVTRTGSGTATTRTITGGTNIAVSDGDGVAANPSVSLTGQVGVANGGTGLSATPANGQVPIGNGSGYTLSTLTAGTGIGIVNSAGSIAISVSNINIDGGGANAVYLAAQSINGGNA